MSSLYDLSSLLQFKIVRTYLEIGRSSFFWCVTWTFLGRTLRKFHATFFFFALSPCILFSPHRKQVLHALKRMLPRFFPFWKALMCLPCQSPWGENIITLWLLWTKLCLCRLHLFSLQFHGFMNSVVGLGPLPWAPPNHLRFLKISTRALSVTQHDQCIHVMSACSKNTWSNFFPVVLEQLLCLRRISLFGLLRLPSNHWDFVYSCIWVGQKTREGTHQREGTQQVTLVIKAVCFFFTSLSKLGGRGVAVPWLTGWVAVCH